MKKLAALFVLMASMLCTLPAMAAEGIHVVVNGESMTFEEVLPNVEGSTFVPLRSIFEKAGIQVQWDVASKTATASRDGIQMIFDNSGSYIIHGGMGEPIRTAYYLQDGKTYVALRAIESFGGAVKWDFTSNTAYISTTTQGFPQVSTADGLTAKVLAGEWFAQWGDVLSFNSSTNWSDHSMFGMGEEGRYTISGNTVSLDGKACSWDAAADSLTRTLDNGQSQVFYRNNGKVITTDDIVGDYTVEFLEDDDFKGVHRLSLSADSAAWSFGGKTYMGSWYIDDYMSNWRASVKLSFTDAPAGLEALKSDYQFFVYNIGNGSFSQRMGTQITIEKQAEN